MTYWQDAFSVKPHDLRLTVSEGTVSITNNTTVINWTLGVYKDPSGTPYGSDGTWSATIHGQTYSGDFSYNFGSYTYLKLASGSKTITHNSDGSKTINVSATAYMGSAAGTATITTKSYEITDIPRATTPTVTPTSGSTGQTFVIGHNAADNSFYHDLAYSIGGGAYVNIATNLPGTDNSTDWTPAPELLPNSTSGTASIRLITRKTSGGTVLGTKYVNLPLNVPGTIKPTVSSVAWTDVQTSGPDIPTLTGGLNRFIQGWSKLKPVVTAEGAGGSTVVAASTVTMNGQQTVSDVAFANAVGLSGAVPFTAIATDTRGVPSDPYVNTVDVTAYNYPNLPTPLVARTSDAAGALPSPTGTYIAITPAASVSSLLFGGVQKNLLEWKIRIKPFGGSYTTVQDWTATGVSGTTWTSKRIFSGYSSAIEYTVEVSVRDWFGKNGYTKGDNTTTKTLTIVVPSEQVFMDWNGNDGLGFKKYHQNGVLDVGGDIYMNGYKVVDLSRLASATQQGIVELATVTESNAHADTERAVTPAGLAELYSNVQLWLNERPVKVSFSAQTTVLIPCTGYDEYEVEWNCTIAASSLVMQIGIGGVRQNTALYDSNNVFAGGTKTTPTSGGDMEELETSWHLSPATSGTRDRLFGNVRVMGLNPTTERPFMNGSLGSVIDAATSTSASSIATANVAGRHRTSNAAGDALYLTTNALTANALTGYYVLRKVKYT